MQNNVFFQFFDSLHKVKLDSDSKICVCSIGIYCYGQISFGRACSLNSEIEMVVEAIFGEKVVSMRKIIHLRFVVMQEKTFLPPANAGVFPSMDFRTIITHLHNI